MAVISFVVLLVSAVLLAIVLIKRHYSYWKRVGAPYETPVFPYGNIKDAKKLHLSLIYDRIYKKFKGTAPFVGLYIFLQPAALILDLDLVKQILIKDFNSFHDRGHYFNERDDPMSAHLFASYGHDWRRLRVKLTPTFTSGKMKLMFPSVVELGCRLQKRLSEMIRESSVIDIKPVYQLFTTDVIGSIAFGIECNSLNGKNMDFAKMGQRIVEEPRHSFPLFMLLLSYRKYANKLRVKALRDEFSEFFKVVVQNNMKYRDENNIKRNDFFDLLLEMRDNTKDDAGLTFNDILANVFIFFIAGYETSSSLLSFCTYELARNQELQSKARAHIEAVLKEHNGEFTYEALHGMVFLDQVLNEALRMYPPIAFLTRIAAEDYRIPGTKYVFKKGTFILIPSFSIHKDERYFENPDIFNPENYSPENVAKRHPMTSLPFGDGPKNCIGLRFGFMQAKIALAQVLQKFRFSLSAETEVPLEYRPKTFILGSKSEIYMKVEEI